MKGGDRTLNPLNSISAAIISGSVRAVKAHPRIFTHRSPTTEGQEMMQLYYMPGACSLADHIVLEWAGAKYETVEMDHKSLKSNDYLALNPGGSVPLLRDGDFLLTQNAAVLHYLAELHPSAHLLGDDTPRARAEVMRWLGFLNSDVHLAFKPLFAAKKAAEDDACAIRLATTAKRQIRDYLRRLDEQLEGRAWIANGRSVADPYLFVIFRWAASMEVDIDGLSNLKAFAERMYADAGVRAALFAEEGIVI